MQSFSNLIKHSGYAKRMPPSLNQIKLYLKKEKNIGAADLASITEENVLEKFIHFN